MSKRETDMAEAVLDAAIRAKCEGKLDQDSLNWMFSKAFEVYRKEARDAAKAERERAEALELARHKESRRQFWAKIWGI